MRLALFTMVLRLGKRYGNRFVCLVSGHDPVRRHVQLRIFTCRRCDKTASYL